MKCVLLVVALALAGCLDFSRFERLPDAAPQDASSGLDASSLDGSSSVVLIDEPFDQLDWTRWYSNSAPESAFTIDGTKVEGTGALAIDITSITKMRQGELSWQGTNLPSNDGSRHVRAYIRYDGDITDNVDIMTLTDSIGSGVAVTLVQLNGSTSPVLNSFKPDSFGVTDAVVNSGEWHCYELAVDLAGGQWTPSLRVDGVLKPGSSAPVSPPDQLTNFSVGMGIAETPKTTTMTARVDAVLVTDGSEVIGCPYPLN